MIFTYKKWECFLKALAANKMYSITAEEYLKSNSEGCAFILKHDVETNVKKAYILAEVEHKYGHKGSYYVQAYLLNDINNINILNKIKNMGHEVTYHHDVMDSNKGDINKAISEFSKNIDVFTKNGFEVITICQHGNPILERVGYSSNRDFFRNSRVKELYPEITDIMVNFPEKSGKEYDYYSDAGRKFKLIFDPIDNDVIKSDDKNISYDNLDEVLKAVLENSKNFIISTHPHRWTSSNAEYIIRTIIFKSVRIFVKFLIKIPIFNKFMSKFYYLAKKI